MGLGRLLLYSSDNTALKVGVTACKLICKGGKDVLELPPVEVIAGTEEASTEESHIGDRF